MFARAAAAAGLGPAQGLPPTLQPMAVLSAAPPAPRAVSFLGASVLYALCAAAVVFAPQAVPKPFKPFLPSGREVVTDVPTTVKVILPNPPPPPPSQDRVLRVKGGPERSAAWRPPTETLTVPTEPPTTLPSVDRTGDSLAALNPADPPTPVGRGTERGTGDGSGHAVASTGQVVSMELTQLQVLRQVAPTYPALARAARRQGSVVLLMTIDTQGVPVEVRLLSSPDPSLAAEAERAARLWRFAPALLNGQPVNAQFRLTLNFRLQ